MATRLLNFQQRVMLNTLGHIDGVENKEEGELNWRKVKSVEGNSGMLSQVGKEAVATLGQRRNYILEARVTDSQVPPVEARASTMFTLGCSVDCISEYLPWSVCNQTSGRRTREVRVCCQGRIGKPCLPHLRRRNVV